jgi:acyl-CoA reductase-like NAD-dependent aldehyde dehydrogenase
VAWHARLVGRVGQHAQHLGPLRQLQQQRQRHPGQRPRAEPVQHQQRHSEHGDDGQDVAAVQQAVHVAHGAQEDQPPQEARRRMVRTALPAVERDEEADAEAQCEDGIGLAAEEKVGPADDLCVECFEPCRAALRQQHEVPVLHRVQQQDAEKG